MLFFKKQEIFLLFLTLIAIQSLVAQEVSNNQDQYQIHAARTEEKIKVDGNLEEMVWKTTKPASGFSHKWPIVGGIAQRQTEVRMTFDAQFLYLGVTCQDTSFHIVQSLKRDVGYWDSDGFAMILDPVNGHSNGFFFGVNAFGAQTEGLVVQNDDDMNFDWNDKWEAETKRYADHWTIEIAIPFKTLRFEEGKSKWGVNFVRNDVKNFQYHIWAPVPQQFDGNNLNFTGALIWDDLPKRNSSKASLIPYISAGMERDNENNQKTHPLYNAGADAKIAVSSSLNLDMTFNPDFSQVEVDAQQTNLTRFDLFLPEKRNFFLENSDIFAQYGLPPLRPFFSRRIGLNSDGTSVPIIGGLRLTGNLDKKTRIGILNMQTAGNEPTNYGAVSLQRQILSKSNIKAMFQNRQGVGEKGFDGNDFSRNLGSEFVYTSDNNQWQIWSAYNHSWKSGVKNNLNNSYKNIGFAHNGDRLNVVVDVLHCGDSYYTDMGFNQRIENYFVINQRDTSIRLGWYQLYNNVKYATYTPDSKWSNILTVETENFIVWNVDGSLNEANYSISGEAILKNSSNINISANYNSLNLLYPIRFLSEEFEPLPAQNYSYFNGKASYSSDVRKRFGYSVSTQYGTFYNGKLLQITTNLNYRIQPWGNFALTLEQNNIKLAADYGSDNLTLLGLRADIAFSKNLIWANYVQYNKQRETFLVNSRLQWRYQPMSDLFLVYTDNYLTTDFSAKYRALVFKMSYWW